MLYTHDEELSDMSLLVAGCIIFRKHNEIVWR